MVFPTIVYATQRVSSRYTRYKSAVDRVAEQTALVICNSMTLTCHPLESLVSAVALSFPRAHTWILSGSSPAVFNGTTYNQVSSATRVPVCATLLPSTSYSASVMGDVCKCCAVTLVLEH